LGYRVEAVCCVCGSVTAGLSKRLPLSYAIAENRPPAVTRMLKAQMVSTFTRFQIGFDPKAEIDHHRQQQRRANTKLSPYFPATATATNMFGS